MTSSILIVILPDPKYNYVGSGCISLIIILFIFKKVNKVLYTALHIKNQVLKEKKFKTKTQILT